MANGYWLQITSLLVMGTHIPSYPVRAVAWTCAGSMSVAILSGISDVLVLLLLEGVVFMVSPTPWLLHSFGFPFANYLGIWRKGFEGNITFRSRCFRLLPLYTMPSWGSLYFLPSTAGISFSDAIWTKDLSMRVAKCHYEWLFHNPPLMEQSA